MKKVKMRVKFTADCYDEAVMNEEEFFRQQEHFAKIEDDSSLLKEMLEGIVSDNVVITDYEITMEEEET